LKVFKKKKRFPRIVIQLLFFVIYKIVGYICCLCRGIHINQLFSLKRLTNLRTAQ